MATVAAAGAVAGACVGFSKSKKFADWWPGLVHGTAHVAAALTVIGFTGRQTRGRPVCRRRATVVAGATGAGATLGPILFAWYLYVADGLGLFGRNTNELFAAQAIEGYKGFLRLHIRRDGGITIYPVKVDRVARWKPDGTWDDPQGAPRFRPERPPEPTLIEAPIEVTPTP